MTTPNSSDMFYQKISYDIFCHNVTIAEYLYSKHIKFPNGCYWSEMSVSGKKFSCTSRFRDLYTLKGWCERLYIGGLEDLAKLFRIEINPEDYPVSCVRAHIHYKYPGMAKYIYDQLTTHGLNVTSDLVNPENIYDLTMEDPNTIGVTCRTFAEVNSLSKIFIGPQNQFTESILLNERIVEYNNRGVLESSTHSLVTSICVMIMFISLISKCCA